MQKRLDNLAVLTFNGARFDDGGLDLAVLPELLAYRDLLVETAKEVWRARNPSRERLPANFDSQIVLKFRSFERGSLVIPIERETEHLDGSLPIAVEDEVNAAAAIIDDAVLAAQADGLRPESLPAALIPFFEALGRTLREDEWIQLQAAQHTKSARWDALARQRISAWTEKTYHDSVDIVGEVTLADVEGCSFTLKLSGGEKISGKFAPSDEAAVTAALQNHQTLRLRVTGRGEFLQGTGKLRRFVETSHIATVNHEDEEYDPSERPIWERIIELAATIPPEELDRLPTDGAEHHDRYLAQRSGPRP